MEVTSECTVVLECHLHCQSEGTTEVKFLSLPTLPLTVLELKEAVQREYSVPACVQRLAFQAEVLADDIQLASRCLRSGDTVDVTFLCHGDCRSTEEVTAWIRNLIQAYDENEFHGEMGDYNIDMVVYNGLQGGLDSALGYDLFEWLIPRTMVNKAYFESIGGLDLLFELYQRIFRREWSSLRFHQKLLECVCTQAFANYGETAALRRKLIKMGLLELCFKSVLRVRVPPNKPITDTSVQEGRQEVSDSLLKAELDNALHLLCWYGFILGILQFSQLFFSLLFFLPPNSDIFHCTIAYVYASSVSCVPSPL